MTDYRTPASKVRGSGASGHGASHWIVQRVTSVALLFLVPVFVWMIATSGAPDPEATKAFLGSSAGSIVTLLTMVTALYHMRLGMQVVIEDYIHKSSTKIVLLIANTLVTMGLLLATVFCLIKFAL